MLKFNNFRKVDIKQNNISTVILLNKFLVDRWDSRHLQGSRVVYIFVYIMKFVLYLISNHIFVCINHKVLSDVHKELKSLRMKNSNRKYNIYIMN